MRGEDWGWYVWSEEMVSGCGVGVGDGDVLVLVFEPVEIGVTLDIWLEQAVRISEMRVMVNMRFGRYYTGFIMRKY